MSTSTSNKKVKALPNNDTDKMEAETKIGAMKENDSVESKNNTSKKVSVKIIEKKFESKLKELCKVCYYLMSHANVNKYSIYLSLYLLYLFIPSHMMNNIFFFLFRPWNRLPLKNLPIIAKIWTLIFTLYPRVYFNSCFN